MATNKNFEIKNGLSVAGTERISAAGVLTGSLASGVTATTQSATDNSTKLATTAYTDAAITAVIGGAPGTLDTLNELAAAIADDASYASTLTTALAGKLPLAGGTMTGALIVNSDISSTGDIRVSGTSVIGKSDDADTYLQFNAADTWRVVTNGGEKLRVNTSGIDVTGTITSSSGLTVNNGHVNLDSGMSYQWGNSHERIEQSDQKIEFFTNNGQQMTLWGGSLGIGTDVPKRPLQIGATNQFPISFNGNYPDIHFNTYYEGGWKIHSAGFGAKTTFNGATGAFVYSNVASSQNAAAGFTPLDRFAILANGNVGVGTNSPSQNFVVAEGTNQHGIELVPGTISYIQAYDRATTDYGNLRIDAQKIGFGLDNGAEKVTFLANGYVGIGTDAPTGTMLHISKGTTGSAGGSDAGITMTNKYDSPDNSWAIQPARSGVSNTGLEIRDVTDSRTDMSFDGAGNVGIGTVSPGSLLDVGGGVVADPVVRIDSAAGGDPSLVFDTGAANRSATIKFHDNGSTAAGFIDYVHNGDKMNFGAGSTTGVTMTVNDGKVGIGTTTPEAPLDITPNANKRTVRVDNISQRGYQEYVISGTIGANAVTITMQCPSYWQAEVTATFQQSNGGTDMNVYYNGIWSNNHTTHLFKNKTDGGAVPRIGGPLSQNPTYSIGVGDSASNTGKLIFTKAAQASSSGTFCVHVRAYGYSSTAMTYVVS